jgi:transcriptional regulator with XRE-family HTH domain
MKKESVNIPRRLKEIRKSTHHSKSNCAKVINVSVEQYESYENDEGLITLPEIELLAACFGVPISSFFQSEAPTIACQQRLNKDTNSKFKEISHKINQAKLKQKISQQEISIGELGSKSGISSEFLHNYLSGSSPIPAKDLLRMIEVLDQPVSDYYSEVFTDSSLEIHEPDLPLISKTDAQKSEEKPIKAIIDAPVQLAQALSQLPIRDQADIARLILQKLKTQPEQ